jgi:hypothetical protein
MIYRNRRFIGTLCAGIALLCAASASLLSQAPVPRVRIGNYFVDSPYGIAFVVDDATGFLVDPIREPKADDSANGPANAAQASPGIAAPDFSFVRSEFVHNGAHIRFTWGRVGSGAVVATLTTDRKVTLTLHLPGTTWPQFHAVYTAATDGVSGYGVKPSGEFVPFVFRSSPVPAVVRANITFDADIVVVLDPAMPTSFAAGIGPLPALDSIPVTLHAAEATYSAHRAAARGDWGDFLGATTDTLNNIRLYGSDNHRVVHGIGRGWWMGKNPDLFPYFEWDGFFDGMMAGLEDAKTGRETMLGVLSFQTPDGRVPSFAHWNAEGGTYVTLHRSIPPVGALCVWKMHQRNPDPAFLAAVYPQLVRWHDWWMKARDGNHNGLLEWGSEQHLWQGAQWETGWDDNVAYSDAKLADTTFNADAVDLSSLWSIDAEYLAHIAQALGKTADARRFAGEHAAMNSRINARLWNDELGIYCSRFWQAPEIEGPGVAQSAALKNGVDIAFYGDSAFQYLVLERRDTALAYNWGDAAPAPGVPSTGWSARIATVFTPAQSGTYRLRIAAGAQLKLSIAGVPVLRWTYNRDQARETDITVEAGKSYPLVLDYLPDSGVKAQLKLDILPLSPGKPGSDWLTRLTPMNFYPLSAGAPTTAQAARTLAWMYREDKFWLPYLLPTVAKDDPEWPSQGYWRGHVWAPANYLVWLGLAQYGDDSHRAEFARRSVSLFMRNWTEKRRNCENFNSTDAQCGGDPHYTWSVLMNWIGLESLAGIDPDFKPIPRSNPALKEDLVLEHVPFGGHLFTIQAHSGHVTATAEPASK